MLILSINLGSVRSSTMIYLHVINIAEAAKFQSHRVNIQQKRGFSNVWGHAHWGKGKCLYICKYETEIEFEPLINKIGLKEIVYKILTLLLMNENTNIL